MTSPIVDAGDDLPLTIGALLRARAAERGPARLLACDDDSITYADAEARSAELARALLAHGAGKGTHVGLLLPNGVDFVVSWLAAARIGAVTLPFSTFSTPTELAGLLAGADVDVLLGTEAYRSHRYAETLSAAIPELDLGAAPPLLAPSVATLRSIWFDVADASVHPGWTRAALLDAASWVGEDVLIGAEAEVAPSDRMVIVHTSGSTSAPKGVIHAHGPLIRHLDNLNQLRSYTPDEVLFSNSPFFWIGGFAYALLGTLVAGGRLVCSNSATAPGVLDVLERERPTMVNGFAQSVAHLPGDPSFAARDLSSIRRGNLWPILPPDVAPADPELRHSMLGMTEAGSVCLLGDADVDLPEHQRGSFGRPAPGFEAEVRDPDTGERAAVGVTGELWLRGPFLMEGYYGRTRAETFDPDGWYGTGDLVHVDGDGLFYFEGRRGDMIKTRGANVSPREVEAAIAALSGLRAHVIGVDDEDAGQLVAAAIVAPEGQVLDVGAVDDLRAGLARTLSAYKVPKVVRVLAESEVPMMSSGKLDARALKALLRGD
jgi:acyl-CoA synthetase (AMP-forming)/AMP-acid ligase II